MTRCAAAGRFPVFLKSLGAPEIPGCAGMTRCAAAGRSPVLLKSLGAPEIPGCAGNDEMRRSFSLSGLRGFPFAGMTHVTPEAFG